MLGRLSSGRGVKLGGTNTQTWLIGGAVFLLLLLGIYYVFFSGNVEHPDDVETAVTDTTGSPTEILSRTNGDTSAGAIGDSGTAAADDSLTLEGRATAKIWYALVMDGKRSETGTIDSGAVKIWRAAETFKLSLGNAGGLQLTLNDKPIGTLGPLRTSVRNQVIDVNGIKKTLPRRTTSASSSQRRQPRTQQPRVITPTEMRTSEPSRP
jgi:hypothetical protein